MCICVCARACMLSMHESVHVYGWVSRHVRAIAQTKECKGSACEADQRICIVRNYPLRSKLKAFCASVAS